MGGRSRTVHSRTEPPTRVAAPPEHDRQPRVLVGWQTWIAGLFSRKTD
jgi:hypothetical protein